MARRVPPRHQNKPKVRIKVKIKKDDTVKVIAGRDRGKTGRVLQVDAEKGKVLIEGVSLVKRHTRPNPQKQIKNRRRPALRVRTRATQRSLLASQGKQPLRSRQLRQKSIRKKYL